MGHVLHYLSGRAPILISRIRTHVAAAPVLLPPQPSCCHVFAARISGSGPAHGTMLASSDETDHQVPQSNAVRADDLGPEDLTPAKVVEMLDRYIVGQTEAKRAVAVALRMRSPALLLPLV